MITRVRTVTVYVKDQDRAVAFYTEKLGFVKRVDEPMGPGGRWIELATPKGDAVIVPFTPPGFEARIGTFSGLVLACDDLDLTFAELSLKGVQFVQRPERQPWGNMAQFKDVDGNTFVLVEEMSPG